MQPRQPDDERPPLLRPIYWVLERLNPWAERHQHDRWFRALDWIGHVIWIVYAVLFALIGAAIAGYALTQGIAGILFAIPVGIGAWMVLKYLIYEPEDEE